MINPTPLVWEILPSLQHQPDCLLWWRWRQVDISHTGGVKSCGHHMLIFHQLIHLFRSKTHGQHPRINCTFTASFNSGQFVVSEQQHGEKLQCHSPDQPATHTQPSSIWLVENVRLCWGIMSLYHKRNMETNTNVVHLFPTFTCMTRKMTPSTTQIEPTTR